MAELFLRVHHNRAAACNRLLIGLPETSNAIDCAASLATAFLELLNHAIEIGVAGAKASCEPVPTTPCDSLAIGEHLKLTSLARRNHGFNAEPLFDEGHETRDLGFVVLSCRAEPYLNFHFCSPTYLVLSLCLVIQG
jgi:hypothetical protein